MKNEKQQQAKNLYFQTNLSKTQIAEMLDVNRRTVMLWEQQGNWDRLKMSAQHLPSMIVEKCYYMLNHYLDNLLSANNTISTFGPKEASAISSLASSIKKIRTRSAVNESMEMFSFFLEDVKRTDPDMADAIRPLIESYIAKRSKTNISDFLPAGFNEQGFLNDPEEDIMEQWLDEQEWEKMDRELAEREGLAGHNAASPSADFSRLNIPSKPGVTQQRPAPVPERPRHPMNQSGTRIESDRLPKEVEKQLTDYLTKENNTPLAVRAELV